MEINSEIKAYFIGFIQTDGYLRRKCVACEISKRDEEILHLFLLEFGGKIRNRSRKTNFSSMHHSSIWRIGSVSFVEELNQLGIPLGSKSKKVIPIKMSQKMEPHYIRGLIDGDGSLGLTSQGFPFLGFTTMSTMMRNYYVEYLLKMGILCNPKRNKRDDIFNVCIYKENAQKVVENWLWP